MVLFVVFFCLLCNTFRKPLLQDNHEFTKTECYHYFHCGCLARYIEFSLQQEKEADDSTKVGGEVLMT